MLTSQYNENINKQTQYKTMKKTILFGSLLAVAALTVTSCSNDDPDPFGGDAVNLDYNSGNAKQWGNYMAHTALLLKNDAQNLADQWGTQYTKHENGKDVPQGASYAELFKNHDARTDYKSTNDCIQEMVEKMGEIANEVGSSKIGDPYAKWTSHDESNAVLAVESWYSWHSRDDYTNNINSIRNAYYGTRNVYTADSVAANSLAAAMAVANPTLDRKVRDYIYQAKDAIQAIAQPFRNHIGSAQTVTAMEACERLQKILGEIDTDEETKPGEATNLKEEALGLDEDIKQNIINNFVDNVVVPTYKELAEKNAALYDAVIAFQKNPSDAGFKACATAWLDARQPWETSEAFLFGPVDELGLDPNMDSWPLDAEGIKNILQSQKWADITEIGEDGNVTESAQNVRGFHTLEYLIFKNGEARKIK